MRTDFRSAKQTLRYVSTQHGNAAISSAVPKDGIVAEFQQLPVGKKALVAARLARQGEGLEDAAWLTILGDLTGSLFQMSPATLASTCMAVPGRNFRMGKPWENRAKMVTHGKTNQKW
eukprot:s4207_g2.t1